MRGPSAPVPPPVLRVGLISTPVPWPNSAPRENARMRLRPIIFRQTGGPLPTRQRHPISQTSALSIFTSAHHQHPNLMELK